MYKCISCHLEPSDQDRVHRAGWPCNRCGGQNVFVFGRVMTYRIVIKGLTGSRVVYIEAETARQALEIAGARGLDY